MPLAKATRMTWIRLIAAAVLSSLVIQLSHADPLWNDPHRVVVPVEHLALTPQNEVQYIQGYFGGEGYIDLSSLVFTASNTTTTTHLDVAVVRVPHQVCGTKPATMADIATTCPRSTWMQHVGIGAQISTGGWFWCCNAQIADQCPVTSTTAEHKQSSSAAYLMVNEQVMDGTVRHLDLNATNHGNATITPVEKAQFEADDQGGYFVILMANCDQQNGKPVDVNGTIVFVSLQEEVEEIVKEEAPFYAWATVAYIALFFWFAHLMHAHQESRIQLEEWIFGTLAIAMAEVLFRAVEYIWWERTGHRNAVLALLAAVLYGTKHGVFRGLLVYLCSGVGVTKDALEPPAQRTLILLTASYVILSASFDYLNYIQQRRAASIEGMYDEESLDPVLGNIFLVLMIIDLTFLVWIPSALTRTITHLRMTNQERKLTRFRWLFRILCAAVGLTLLLIVALILDLMYDDGKLASELDVSKVNEINVFVILVLVAILWRPNPMAREYAYVMEAPTEENDLELVESSATATGITETPDANYKSFPVESAEAT